MQTNPNRTALAARPLTRNAQQKKQLIKALSRKNSVDIKTISAKFGWQDHSTRAALSGLRKAGYELGVQKKSGKPTRYSIASTPASVEAQRDAT